MNEASTELLLTISNEGTLYNQRQSIEKNLTIKKAKGIFDADLARKLWRYWVDAGAKWYVKHHGGSFTVAERDDVAKELVLEFEAEYNLGNFNKYVPKKYARSGSVPLPHRVTNSRDSKRYGPKG